MCTPNWILLTTEPLDSEDSVAPPSAKPRTLIPAFPIFDELCSALTAMSNSTVRLFFIQDQFTNHLVYLVIRERNIVARKSHG